MVQRPCCQGRPRGAVSRARLHGHQTLRLRHLGKDAAATRQDVQGDRRTERLFPPPHPQILPLPRGGARGRLRQRVRRGDPLPPQDQRQRRRRRR